MKYPSLILLMLTVMIAMVCVSCGGSTTGPIHADQQSLHLNLVSGNNQTAVVGSTLPSPIQLQVVDQNNQPVPFIIVQWIVAPTDGSTSTTSTESSSTGMVTNSWSLGDSIGTQNLVVELPNHQSVTITATATAAPPPPPPPDTTHQACQTAIPYCPYKFVLRVDSIEQPFGTLHPYYGSPIIPGIPWNTHPHIQVSVVTVVGDTILANLTYDVEYSFDCLNEYGSGHIYAPDSLILVPDYANVGQNEGCKGTLLSAFIVAYSSPLLPNDRGEEFDDLPIAMADSTK